MINEDKKCNNLSGKEWLQNSFSIWRGIGKTKEEKALAHPASYPVELCEKLISTFSKPPKCRIIDPFNGIGSTLVAAENLGCSGVGIDLSEEFCNKARQRITSDSIEIIQGDSLVVLNELQENSFDICITSPPYWDILNMKRSADMKATVNYSENNEDLGNIDDYQRFITLIGDVFAKVHRVLRKGGYCIVNVMDIRKKSEFYPLHSDLATEMKSRGYIFDDIIIWDRQNDYNNMRPLGYPYKFRINKVHEFLLIFVK